MRGMCFRMRRVRDWGVCETEEGGAGVTFCFAYLYFCDTFGMGWVHGVLGFAYAYICILYDSGAKDQGPRRTLELNIGYCTVLSLILHTVPIRLRRCEQFCGWNRWVGCNSLLGLGMMWVRLVGYFGICSWV